MAATWDTNTAAYSSDGINWIGTTYQVPVIGGVYAMEVGSL